MSFNFGAQPFKHEPIKGYIAVCQTPKNNLKNSEAISGNSSGGPKKINNAPQAIIIEVCNFYKVLFVFLSCFNDLIYHFSLREN